ncbi:MAG: OmpH family outer membrane protein [Rikenellaceae bacterium]
MKNLFIFAVAATISLTACNTNTTSTPATTPSQESTVAASGQIAFVMSEKVLAESEIYQTEGVALRAKSEKAQASWSKTEQGFQYEVSQLQEKYQKGLITSANAQKQQESIEARIKTYQTNTQKEAQLLEEENAVFSNRLQDLFRRAVKQLNEDKKYQMILDASSIIDADTTLDVSNQVLEIVNQLYAAESK